MGAPHPPCLGSCLPAPLLQAVQRLEKARVEEADARRRVEAIHAGAAGPLSDSDVKRRTKAWSSAIAEVGITQNVQPPAPVLCGCAVVVA